MNIKYVVISLVHRQIATLLGEKSTKFLKYRVVTNGSARVGLCRINIAVDERARSKTRVHHNTATG